jgi:arabinogalactan endo-1,4-beta-galactosidase
MKKSFFKTAVQCLIVISIVSCSGVLESDSSDDLVSVSELENLSNAFIDRTNAMELSSSLPDFFYGADLSYVNEMEDCGAVYRDFENRIRDVYDIFSEVGANLVRYRLWHNPTWTDYSNLADVKKAIRRAKDRGLYVLLDFHYSDTWTDPGHQQIPAAWLPLIDDTPALAQKLYDYTYQVLDELHNEGLTPDIVQIGNEINAMILQDGDPVSPIDWNRNSTLLNKGIDAVRDISEEINQNIEIMLHIAQPENGHRWFEQATNAGVIDYDWIGLSYYPTWSEYKVSDISHALKDLTFKFEKKVMIVETAYPFTSENVDNANNPLTATSEYPASKRGQLDFLMDLTREVKSGNGSGIVYWEPAWVSTECGTLWAESGSHWDNATLFDFSGRPTKGILFYIQTFRTNEP